MLNAGVPSVYYDLLNERRRLGVKHTAIVRLEQLSPFPWSLVTEQGLLYPNAQITWAQEEAQNMGGFTYAYLHLVTALGGKR